MNSNSNSMNNQSESTNKKDDPMSTNDNIGIREATALMVFLTGGNSHIDHRLAALNVEGLVSRDKQETSYRNRLDAWVAVQHRQISAVMLFIAGGLKPMDYSTMSIAGIKQIPTPAVQPHAPLLNLAPTREQVRARFMLLARDDNDRMIQQEASRLVRGSADRKDLAQELCMALAEGTTLSIAGEAVALLEHPDGTKIRGRARYIIRNLGRDMARTLRTQSEREVLYDPIEQERRQAAIKNDGPSTKADRDGARYFINHEQLPETDKQKAARPRDEFIRRAERINEKTVGSTAWDGRGRIEVLREQSLENMLRQALRVGGLHDLGRIDRADQYALSTWATTFFGPTTWMRAPTNKDEWAHSIIAKRVERLDTLEARAWATFILAMCGNKHESEAVRPTRTSENVDGPSTPDKGSGILMNGQRRRPVQEPDENTMAAWVSPTRRTDGGWTTSGTVPAVLVAIATGQAKTLGSLVAACCSTSIDRTRKFDDEHATAADDTKRTIESMRVHWATLTRTLGFDSTPDNVKAVKTLVQRHAAECGADGVQRGTVMDRVLVSLPSMGKNEQAYRRMVQREQAVAALTEKHRQASLDDVVVEPRVFVEESAATKRGRSLSRLVGQHVSHRQAAVKERGFRSIVDDAKCNRGRAWAMLVARLAASRQAAVADVLAGVSKSMVV